MFDSYKKMRNVKVNKLSRSQRKMVHFNQALLLFRMGKESELKALVKQDPKDENLNIVMAAMLFKKDQNHKKCTEYLEKYFGNAENVKATGGAVQSKLAAAHVYILNGYLREAVKILKDIPSLQNTPGTTATLMAFTTLGRQNRSRSWTRHSKHHQLPPYALMSSGALEDLNKRRYEAACTRFEDILRMLRS